MLEVDGIDSKTFKIVYGVGLSKGKVLTRMLQSRGGADGEIAYMKLVDYKVGRRCQCWALVVVPSLWVGVCQVYDCSALSIDSNGFSKCAGALAASHVESVELAVEVALDCRLPSVGSDGAHLYCLDGFSSLAVLIYAYFGHRWSVEAECGLCFGIDHLIESSLCVCR